MPLEQKSPIKYATREPEWFHTFRYQPRLPVICAPDTGFRPPDLAAGEPARDRRKAQRLASALSQEADVSTIAQWVRARALYADGVGGHPTNGIRAALESMTLDDVKARYTQLLKPAGSTVVVVGAVDKTVLKTALETALGDWKGAPTAAPRNSQAQDYVGLHLVDFPGAAQSVVMMARAASSCATGFREAVSWSRQSVIF